MIFRVWYKRSYNYNNECWLGCKIHHKGLANLITNQMIILTLASMVRFHFNITSKIS